MNLRPNESRKHVYENLWGINMQILMDYLIEDSGEHRKCGHLPYMRYNFPCHVRVLTSESFSKRMISVANLLVHAHRIRLGHNFIDKLILYA